jgi:hypothetical protein
VAPARNLAKVTASRAEPAGGDRAGEPVIAEPANHAIGRSHGGLTTKVHALTDGRGRALVVLLTAGKVNDTTMFARLPPGLRVARTGPGQPRTRPDHLLVDKGRSSRAQPRAAAAPGHHPHHP